MTERWRRRRRGDERGQETLQTIFAVAFVLMPVLLAIFTFGSVIHLYIGEQAAAARGARIAGADGGFGAAEYSSVIDALNTNGVDSNSCSVSSNPVGRISLGQAISVTVHCPQTISIPFLFEKPLDVKSTFVARGEVNQ